MATAIEASRALVYKAAWAMDNSLPSNRIAAIAKYHASQTAKMCADKAMQIFGGYGMAREYRVSWLPSYADLFFTGEGSANVQKIMIAEDALGYKIADRHHGKTACATDARAMWRTRPAPSAPSRPGRLKLLRRLDSRLLHKILPGLQFSADQPAEFRGTAGNDFRAQTLEPGFHGRRLHRLADLDAQPVGNVGRHPRGAHQTVPCVQGHALMSPGVV